MAHKIEQFIGVFENAVSDEVCQNLINYFDNYASMNKVFNRRDQGFGALQKEDSILAMGHETDIVQVRNFTANMAPVADALDGCYRAYMDKYNILSEITRHRIAQTYQIQKTKPGQGYHVWHCEADCISSASRIAVPIVYLNDVEEGGETEFLYQNMRVAPKRGTVVLFPASFTHTHRGNPPLSGDKYIVTTWIELLE